MLRAKVMPRSADVLPSRQMDQATGHERFLRTNEDLDKRTRAGLVVPGAGTLTVCHGLGRMLKGWRVTRGGNNALTSDPLTWTSTLFIIANAGAAATIDVELW